jgi:hypothetical protein
MRIEPVPALVWLDDLTVADLDHLTGDVLSEVAKKAIILATMRDRNWEEIYYADSEITLVSRSALHRTRKFELRFELTPSERSQASRYYPDQESVFGLSGTPVSIAETLVGGERLWTRYCAGLERCPRRLCNDASRHRLEAVWLGTPVSRSGPVRAFLCLRRQGSC